MRSATGSAATLTDRCLHQVRLFFIALQFFTRLPIPRWVGFEPQWLQHASRYFALVGVVVAAVSCAVYAVTIWLLPQVLAVLLAVIAGIWLTGAFHEDGFADVCDGFGGGMTEEGVLEIMKDSRIGAYGAIGIGCMLALKCVALCYFPVQVFIAALFIAHPLSRLAASALIWLLDYARAEGKAKPMAQQMTTLEFMIAGATVVLPVVLFGLLDWLSWFEILAGASAAALAALYLSRMFVRRIGGYTGDCLGAVQQLTELAFYLGVLACLDSGLAI
jgi:adenosylcobinamide-GDP ribazoletransferase